MYHEENSLLKIAVAEDHTLFRDSLCNTIDTWENCKVIIRAANGCQLLEKINPADPPELVLTDLQMPEMNGYETARELSKRHKDIKIIVISQYHSEEMLLHLIQCGAHGFIHKRDELSRLKKAMTEIRREGYFFSDHMATNLVRRAFHSGQINQKNELSEEEWLFLFHICSDKSYKEIAADMNLPARHVDYIRNGLFERFNVKTRTGLAMAAVQKGLNHGTPAAYNAR